MLPEIEAIYIVCQAKGRYGLVLYVNNINDPADRGDGYRDVGLSILGDFDSPDEAADSWSVALGFPMALEHFEEIESFIGVGQITIKDEI